MRTGDDRVRKQAIPNLVRGRWDLGPWTWQRTMLVSQLHAGDYFSVNRYLADDPGPPAWYVNFELPYRRTGIGFDTFDLLLDLVVEADLSAHRWKDEDEYQQARRLGLISDAVHTRVGAARDEVLSLVQTAEGPFAHDWSDWRPSRAWPVPTLPEDCLTEPAES
jgi:protein associated with RNAse G/E